MSTEASIQIHPRKPRHHLKGRQATDAARAEVRALIGAAPPEGHRRDLLIEHLHALNDHYHGLFERHLVALAAEMRLSMAEVAADGPFSAFPGIDRTLAVLARGRIVHHGAAADPDTHRAVERVFDHRIAIHSVAGQWMALPRLHPAAALPSPDLNENPSHAN